MDCDKFETIFSILWQTVGPNQWERLTSNFGFLTMARAEGGQPSFGDIWSGDRVVLIIACRKAQDPDESSGGRRRLGVIWLPLLLVRTLLVI